MKMKKDSIVLSKGKYPIKVWYFQGMPDRYGLVLDAKIIGKPAICPIKSMEIKEKKDNGYFTKIPSLPIKRLKLKKSGKVQLAEKISLKNSILFEIGKAELKDSAIIALKKIAKIIHDKTPKSILISGHTDNTGSFELNQKLSLKRATAVLNQLQFFIENPIIKMTAYGEADSLPIATNDTTEGRAKNRRVEILLNN